MTTPKRGAGKRPTPRKPAPRTGNPPGRPPVFPDATLELAICENLKIGHSRTQAADRAGVGRKTLFVYLAAAEERGSDGKFTKRARAAQRFRAAVLRAESDATTAMLACVMKAASTGDARAAQWWLARRHPKEWGDRSVIELKVANEREALIDVLKEMLPDEQYRAVLGALAQRDIQDDDDER